jgi:hypothetical protein
MGQRSRAQTYILDGTGIAQGARLPGLRPEIMDIIRETLLELIPYTRILRTMMETAEAARPDGEGIPDLTMTISADPTRDHREFNLPTVDEVAERF